MSDRKAKLEANQKIKIINIIEARSNTSIESSFSDLPRQGEQFECFIESFKVITMTDEENGGKPPNPPNIYLTGIIIFVLRGLQ